MSSIKVVSINEEAKLEPIEEAKEEVVEEQVENEEAKKEVVEPTNEVVDNTPVEKPKEEIEKTKPENKKVQCPKCLKYMSNKNFRYRHEKLCTTEPKPVKPFSKPRAKPKAQPKIENVVEAPPPVKTTQEVSNQVFKPTPVQPQLSPYEVARQSYIQMKEEVRQKKIEKINSFKSKMF